MIILGIETSCDETSASVVENGRTVLSHVLASSAHMHAKTGGIIPEMAAREQVKAIIPVIREAIENSKEAKLGLPSGLKIENLDAIGVTVGPGLIGSLLVGVETAKTLAWIWNKPIVPVNHLLGHIYANFIREIPNDKFQMTNEILFPALALVVSGGHTDLVLMRDHGKVEWIGGTRDDAAGEAFDKTARLLGLPYPGGPAISAAAEKFQITSASRRTQLNLFPRPMINEDNFDWSFSGLKTAVAREVQKRNISPNDIPRLAAEVQEAIVDVLTQKVIRAAKKFKPKSLLLGGGVAANGRLREKMRLAIGHLSLDIKLSIASPQFCTDNASMIAAAAYYNYKQVSWKKVTAIPGLTILGET